MVFKEISIHQARIFLAVKSTEGRWVTNPDVYDLLPDISKSLIRNTVLEMFKRGLVERVVGHPLYRHRWSTRKEGRDHEFEVRMEAACDAFGLLSNTNARFSQG